MQLSIDYVMEFLNEKAKQKHARSLQLLERGDTAGATFASGGESVCLELKRELNFLREAAARAESQAQERKEASEYRKTQRRLSKQDLQRGAA